MWHEISDKQELLNFMETVCSFHDSCIKEMKYLSGAYVNDDLSMHPINEDRTLRVIVQRQFKENPMVELEFGDLKYLNLYPISNKYTCEILGSTMVLKNGLFYWGVYDDTFDIDLNDFEGTIICASTFRWRTVHNCLGSTEFYVPTC